MPRAGPRWSRISARDSSRTRWNWWLTFSTSSTRAHRTPRGCAACWPPPGCTRPCSRCAAARTRCCAEWSPRAWAARSNELTQLVDDIGRRSFDARLGHRGAPDEFDAALWRHLEETGLSRLTSSQEAGPAEAAIVLSGLARHAGAVPIAETDLLAAWLAGEAAVDVPDERAADRRDHRRGRPSTAGSSARRPMSRGRTRPRCYWPRAPPKHSTSLSSTTPE